MTAPIELTPEDREAAEGFDDEYEPEADRCPVCGGDGMDDDVTECQHCDGEGYEWWM